MGTTRWRHVPVAIAAALAVIVASASPASGQSGTRVRNAFTIMPSGAVTIDFQVAGPVPGGDATSLILEFAPDGNDATIGANPLATPSGVGFALSMGGTAATAFTAADAVGGTATPTGIANKEIRMDYTAHGRYVLTITHGSTVAVGTTENWRMQVTGLSGVRIVGFVDAARISDINPAGVCATTGGGGVCPPCRDGPCLGGIYDIRIPLYVWPRPGPIRWPGPWCLSCPRVWMEEFDRAQFDRVVVAVTPTPENGIAPGCGLETQFTIEGGTAVGDMVQGANGECMQMFQYAKGTPPQVNVMSEGKQVTSFRAEPQVPGGREGLGTKLGFGIGGLVLGALAGLALGRGRGPRTNTSRPA